MRAKDFINENKRPLFNRGDCFEVAGRAMLYPIAPGLKLVHAHVTGQGSLLGKRHAHAWNEIGDVVLDNSNGRNIVMRKEQYYELGKILTKPGDYAVYDDKDARKKMSQYKHYGPWDLDSTKADISEDLEIKLGPQLYVPRPKDVNEELKPKAEVWTSTAKKATGEYTSDWVEWCKSEMPQWITKTGTLYEVLPGAKILQLNTDKQLKQLASKYGVKVDNDYELMMQMPWREIANDYDAIHHIPTNRWDNLIMSSWDVESTAWFNTKYLTKIKEVPIAGI
jgi:hypothetical protein